MTRLCDVYCRGPTSRHGCSQHGHRCRSAEWAILNPAYEAHYGSGDFHSNKATWQPIRTSCRISRRTKRQGRFACPQLAIVSNRGPEICLSDKATLEGSISWAMTIPSSCDNFRRFRRNFSTDQQTTRCLHTHDPCTLLGSGNSTTCKNSSLVSRQGPGLGE